jgi:hypothetical protein
MLVAKYRLNKNAYKSNIQKIKTRCKTKFSDKVKSMIFGILTKDAVMAVLREIVGITLALTFMLFGFVIIVGACWCYHYLVY